MENYQGVTVGGLQVALVVKKKKPQGDLEM